LLEVFAAFILIATVANHEREVRFEAFDANLRATSSELLGSVQEADSNDGSVRLDLQGGKLSPRAIYRVSEDGGQVLGEHGIVPPISHDSGTIFRTQLQNRTFRFSVLKGDRVIDPNTSMAVIHKITVVYGLPEGRMWHEIVESIRYFAIATFILLGVTAVFMSWLIGRLLRPIHELALEAEKIDADHWAFDTPESSRKFRELRPLASAIETTIARLQRSFQQQRRFTSDAAHELKTDLAIVKSSVQLLTMKRRTVEEYEQGLSLGLDDISRLEATVQKMLTLARLEQGPKGEHQQCDFSEVVRDAITQSQSYADIKDVAILTPNIQSGARVPLNPEDALLLCSNILMNAIQHSSAQSQIVVSLTTQQDELELCIRDHGTGVFEVDLPFLFEAFYRGDASRSRKSGGTGLGLSICKAICDRSGGRISIANHASGGAEVSVSLPLIQ